MHKLQVDSDAAPHHHRKDEGAETTPLRLARHVRYSAPGSGEDGETAMMSSDSDETPAPASGALPGEGTDRARVQATLDAAAAAPDDQLALAETALALAALDRPNDSLQTYLFHLKLLAAATAEAARQAPPGLDGAIAALHAVMARRFGYVGDSETYDDTQNANLMRVIDRRRGLPVALGILYLHAGRGAGWRVQGLSFPGHFLIRLEVDGERAIVDPFAGGRSRTPVELRAMIKGVLGLDAELMPEHHAPVSDRAVLLRLQNNIKMRHLQAQEAELAQQVVAGMLRIAPRDASLWREAGLLKVRRGDYDGAVADLEQSLSVEDSDRERHRTATILQKLRSRRG